VFRTTVEVHDGIATDDPSGELFIDVSTLSAGALFDVIAIELGEPGANLSSRPS
jgi:hypothetical protein